MNFFRRPPIIPLGTQPDSLWRTRTLGIPLSDIYHHGHIIGVSGSGKSRFLASLYMDLFRRGIGATLIDPHGDLTRLILGSLVQEKQPINERLVYLDLPGADAVGRYLPLNIMCQPGAPTTVAANLLECFHRAWPTLGDGMAPRFDKLVLNGVKVLLSAGEPLPMLFRFLTDFTYRNAIVAYETDPDVAALWTQWYDKLPERLRLDYSDSTLTRVNLLTFAPILKYSLSQPDLALNWRQIMDSGTSVLVDLSVREREPRRLLGSLITVGMEQAALSRANTITRRPHFLIIDEFAEFSAQSEEALSTMLSQTRKFGLHVIMAHQNWTQASERLRGAMGNARFKVAFQLTRTDAERTALEFARVDPLAVKHEVADEHALGRTHPVFYSLPEQWEERVQRLQDFPTRQALIKLPSGQVEELTTLPMPDPVVSPALLEAVEADYLRRYFRVPVVREVPPPTIIKRGRL